MTIIVGGVDLFRQGLENEHRITVLEMILEKVLEKNPHSITQQEIDTIKDEAFSLIKKKYPDAAIGKGVK